MHVEYFTQKASVPNTFGLNLNGQKYFKKNEINRKDLVLKIRCKVDFFLFPSYSLMDLR